MKYHILNQFNLNKDLLTESHLREMQYDTGDLKKILKGKKSFFYNIKSNGNSKNITHSLIFIPDFSSNSLTSLQELSIPTKNCFYFVEQLKGDYQEKIIKILGEQKIAPFNFILFFRKSNFNNWEIALLNSKNLNIRSIVLNTILALGANLAAQKVDTKKMTFFKNIPLSFQHSIDLYKMK